MDCDLISKRHRDWREERDVCSNSILKPWPRISSEIIKVESSLMVYQWFINKFRAWVGRVGASAITSFFHFLWIQIHKLSNCAWQAIKSPPWCTWLVMFDELLFGIDTLYCNKCKQQLQIILLSLSLGIAGVDWRKKQSMTSQCSRGETSNPKSQGWAFPWSANVWLTLWWIDPNLAFSLSSWSIGLSLGRNVKRSIENIYSSTGTEVSEWVTGNGLRFTPKGVESSSDGGFYHGSLTKLEYWPLLRPNSWIVKHSLTQEMRHAVPCCSSNTWQATNPSVVHLDGHAWWIVILYCNNKSNHRLSLLELPALIGQGRVLQSFNSQSMTSEYSSRESLDPVSERYHWHIWWEVCLQIWSNMNHLPLSINPFGIWRESKWVIWT